MREGESEFQICWLYLLVIQFVVLHHVTLLCERSIVLATSKEGPSRLNDVAQQTIKARNAVFNSKLHKTGCRH
jgi:hypothetical protein